MIWYFIAGFISGFVGCLMILSFIGKRIEKSNGNKLEEVSTGKTGD